MKPQFEHNGCKSCVFLGTIITDKEYDLYYCKQISIPTVIARFGIDGDYCSGMGMEIPELKIAEKIAKHRGLCK